MLNHTKVAKEQLLHVLFGTLFFLVIAAGAVALDMLSAWVVSLGVSEFTTTALSLTAHAILVADLLLFFAYLVVSSLHLIKELR